MSNRRDTGRPGSLHNGVASTPRLFPPAARRSRRSPNMASTPGSATPCGRWSSRWPTSDGIAPSRAPRARSSSCAPCTPSAGTISPRSSATARADSYPGLRLGDRLLPRAQRPLVRRGGLRRRSHRHRPGDPRALSLAGLRGRLHRRRLRRELAAHAADAGAHRRLGDAGATLVDEPLPDAPRRVALLAPARSGRGVRPRGSWGSGRGLLR